MATVPSEDTAVVGGKITAAYGNADIRDAINLLLNPPDVHVTNTTGLSHTSGTALLLTWDTEVADTDTMHSGSFPSRLFATTAGLYAVVARASFASNATGIRTLDVRKNAVGAAAGGTRVGFDSATAVGGSTVTSVNVALDVRLAAGDYLEAFGFQSSGGALALDASAGLTLFQMRMVSL